jgi:hypothetical protein
MIHQARGTGEVFYSSNSMPAYSYYGIPSLNGPASILGQAPILVRFVRSPPSCPCSSPFLAQVVHSYRGCEILR